MELHNRVQQSIDEFMRNRGAPPRFLYISPGLWFELMGKIEYTRRIEYAMPEYYGLRVVLVMEPEWLEIG